LDGAGIPRPGSGGIAFGSENLVSLSERKADMTVVWIIIVVLALLALIWVLSRRRGRA